MEHYAGADLHKRVTQLALLREGKPPAQFRFRNEKHTVEKALKGLPSGTKIAVEATGTWWWFVEQARALDTRSICHTRSRPRRYRQHG